MNSIELHILAKHFNKWINSCINLAEIHTMQALIDHISEIRCNETGIDAFGQMMKQSITLQVSYLKSQNIIPA